MNRYSKHIFVCYTPERPVTPVQIANIKSQEERCEMKDSAPGAAVSRSRNDESSLHLSEITIEDIRLEEGSR